MPQSSGITGALPSDRLVPYPVYSLVESYPTAKMQSVYSASQLFGTDTEGIRINK